MVGLRLTRLRAMDLKIDRPNEPGNIDQLNKPEDAARRLQSVVELVDSMTVSVASNVKYQHDFMVTAEKRGSSFMERSDRFYQDHNPPPVLPRSEHTVKALAFQVTKNSETTVSHAKRDLTMPDLNTNFCKPCRRIFDGNGIFMLPITKPERSLYYSDWDAQMLKRSARSCLLCLLVHRAMGTPVASSEFISLHYNIVGFVQAKDVYGVRFSSYVMVSDGETISPYVAAQIMITIGGLGPL